MIRDNVMRRLAVFLLAVTALVALTGIARADLCEQASARRIHITLLPTGRLAYIDYNDQGCFGIGPVSESYSWDELMKKRDEENSVVNRVDSVRTTEALKLIFGSVLLQNEPSAQFKPGTHEATATPPSADDLQRLPLAKENLSVMELKLLKPSEGCIYVPSIDAHKRILERVLLEVRNARPLEPVVAEQKVEKEITHPKYVPHPSKPKAQQPGGPGKSSAN